jgi:hypothetical protein
VSLRFNSYAIPEVFEMINAYCGDCIVRFNAIFSGYPDWEISKRGLKTFGELSQFWKGEDRS